MTEPQGTLSVWHIQNPPAEPTWHPVLSPAEGYRKIQELAFIDLKDDTIFANAIGLSILEGEDMVDWYDEEGDDIDAWAEKAEKRPCVLCHRPISIDRFQAALCGQCLAERTG